MADLDAVRQHLSRYLSNHSPDEVIAYLEKWAVPGRELSIVRSGSYIQYPFASGILGERSESSGIPLPWIFATPESADEFCGLVETAFRTVGARCVVAGRRPAGDG